MTTEFHGTPEEKTARLAATIERITAAAREGKIVGLFLFAAIEGKDNGDGTFKAILETTSAGRAAYIDQFVPVCADEVREFLELHAKGRFVVLDLAAPQPKVSGGN